MDPSSPTKTEIGTIFPKIALPTSSGYLSTSFPAESSSSRLFYTFYEATHSEKPIDNTPLILWLNGGPGRSSQIGNFYEIGPWKLEGPDSILHLNDFSWNHEYALLFIDSPAGTGFSVAASDEDIPTTIEDETKHVYNALSAFFALHPRFKTRPFLIAGESFAGNVIPMLADTIVKERGLASMAGCPFPFKLSGVAIGNGLTDPAKQVLTWGATLHSFGMLDVTQKRHVDATAEQIEALIDCEEWARATVVRKELVDWIASQTGTATIFDVRRTVPYHHTEDGEDFLATFLNRPDVKAVLKADHDVEWFNQNSSVLAALQEEVTKSSKEKVETLLAEGVPVLLFQGQFDAKNGPASNEAWLRNIDWQSAEEFWGSKRVPWKVGNVVAGFRREFGVLTHVTILGAGLMVGADQPASAKAMIDTWIQGIIKEPPVIVPETPTRKTEGYLSPKGGWFGWFANRDANQETQ